MPDLTQGYRGYGSGGSTAIVDAIFRQAPLDPTLPGQLLAARLFDRNFIPYARLHFVYDGSRCNCEDLSSALWATWHYVVSVKRPAGLGEPPRAEKVRCLDDDGMITKAFRVFAGPANGNVRKQDTGILDGRCLFPVHWICRIGMAYFDPTYARSTTDPEDIVERRLTKPAPGLWLSMDRRFLYALNHAAAPQFSDSWNEMDARGWISSVDWKTKTARTGHSRSADLERLDAALPVFEQQGAAALAPLKTAFESWFARNPKEASTRDHQGCVSGLASFLGVAVHRHV